MPTCSDCHGDASSPAPPLAIDGSDALDALGVGAHRQHLIVAPSWHREVLCEDCHIVPVAVGDVGHIDSLLPAELTWGEVATADRALPAFDRATATCSGVYCHGPTLRPGGSITEPVWTTVDGTQAVCGTCHGLPPEAHPVSGACSTCHPDVATSGREFFSDPERHIDGVVDVDITALTCTSCHGDDAIGPAPPVDTSGSDDTASRGVGAHESHLGASDWHAEIACEECHELPATIDAAGHTDSSLPAELIWGALATDDGATAPVFDGTTCAAVYCHGSTLGPGGTNTEPAWTTVDGSQAACGTCHGAPPSAPHPGGANCAACHAEVMATATTFLAPELHVDGVVQASRYHAGGWADPALHGSVANDDGAGLTACAVCHGATLDGGEVGVSCDACHAATSADWTTDCTFCHGDRPTGDAAPPEGADGETARTTLEVGAHQEHVEDTRMHAGRSCSVCHVEPASVFSSGHIDGDGTAEVRFDALNPSATYNPITGTCSGLYCHGNGWSTNGSADWDTDPTLTCTSCHPSTASSERDFDTMSGEHTKHAFSEGYECSLCHAGVVNSSDAIIALELHVDGSPDVQFDASASGVTWNGSTCTGICHGENHRSARW
jgi:predicted CxxxxCH...CXXCH cytochrome family protein